ncbi:MAG TPA: GDP-mannose 4,6-dehydratase, partial [Gaiellaceae bacterium]
MRVLVTGGAGFIGSHFVARLAAGGDDAVVLDLLTYAGNRANLEGIEHEFHHGDICDDKAVARAARGCEVIVNFAAESHVDRSIHGPAEFIRTDVLGT